MEGTGVGFVGERHYQREKNVPDIRHMCCKVPNMSEAKRAENNVGAEDGRVPGILETLRRTVAFVPTNCREAKGLCADGDV